MGLGISLLGPIAYLRCQQRRNYWLRVTININSVLVFYLESLNLQTSLPNHPY
jgi:hypothetical protein